MTDPDATLLKVRKLLTLAENPAATPAEAAAFTAKATQLMADYGIDQALLAHESPQRRIVGDRVIGLDAPYSRDKCSLAATIAHHSRCQSVMIQKGSSVSVHVFGLEPDLMCVEILLTSLLLQGTRDLAATPVPWGEHAAAYRRSWWAGFRAAISRRLAEAEQQSVVDADRRRPGEMSAALVLADHSHEAELAMHDAYPNLQSASRRRLSGGGSRDGFVSGQRADLDVRSSVDQRDRGELTG